MEEREKTVKKMKEGHDDGRGGSAEGKHGRRRKEGYMIHSRDDVMVPMRSLLFLPSV